MFRVELLRCIKASSGYCNNKKCKHYHNHTQWNDSCSVGKLREFSVRESMGFKTITVGCTVCAISDCVYEVELK